MAGPEGFEPPAFGFGDRRSTVGATGLRFGAAEPRKTTKTMETYCYTDRAGLTRFSVNSMRTAKLAVFLKLKSPGMVPLILLGSVITLLAFLTCKGNYFRRPFCQLVSLPPRRDFQSRV